MIIEKKTSSALVWCSKVQMFSSEWPVGTWKRIILMHLRHMGLGYQSPFFPVNSKIMPTTGSNVSWLNPITISSSASLLHSGTDVKRNGTWVHLESGCATFTQTLKTVEWREKSSLKKEEELALSLLPLTLCGQLCLECEGAVAEARA